MFECTFDRGTCDFTQNGETSGDNVEWRRRQGQTPTSGTGPEGDHTTGQGEVTQRSM